MTKKVSLLILLIALIIGTTTRLYQLGHYPTGLHIDEAAQGYNALSILKTGKDEFGMPYPIIFRSFTDFKTPVYTYLLVPVIYFFGLTPTSVRLPSFLLGTLSLPILYLLIRKLTPSKIAPQLAAIITLLLAISPWHVLFSRVAFETNIALFFFLLGAYFLYLSLDKPKFLPFAAAAFAVTIPAYHSQRIITPLFLIIFFILYRHKFLSPSHKKNFTISLFLGLILLLPTLKTATTPGFLARGTGLSILNLTKHTPSGLVPQSAPFSHILNIRALLSLKEYLSLYTAYFSPRNIFYLGDYESRVSLPELASFYTWQFPFYLHGLYLIFKNKNLGQLKSFTLLLLFISPLPAALTHDPYSTIRALPILIPQLTLIGLSITCLINKYRKTRLILAFTFSALLVFSLFKLYSSTVILFDHYRAPGWYYGGQEVADFIKESEPTSLPFIIDNTRTEPHIHLLFYLQFNPADYQVHNSIPPSEYYTNLNRNKNKRFGNIQTRPINWEKDLLVDQFIVGDNLAISDAQIDAHSLVHIKDIFYPDGSVAFRIVRTAN